MILPHCNYSCNLMTFPTTMNLLAHIEPQHTLISCSVAIMPSPGLCPPTATWEPAWYTVGFALFYTPWPKKPNITCHLCFLIKFFWNSVTSVHLHIVCGCFRATGPELNGPLKTKLAHPFPLLFRDCILTPCTHLGVIDHQRD